MIRALTFLSVLSFLSVPSVLFSQQNTAVMVQGTNLVPTNAAGVISNALGLGPFATNTSLAVSNISGLQPALDGKLATNGTAASAVMLTNSITGEKFQIEQVFPGSGDPMGGRMVFWANQYQDPIIGMRSAPLPGDAPGDAGATYITMGMRNGQGFLATTYNGFTGAPNSSVRIETHGGQLTKLWAKTLLLQGGTINAPNATSTASTNVANVGTLDARYEPKKVYAVFDIPLGGSYTDFELKASVSNYATNSTYTNGMVFFYHSPDPGKSAIPEQIWSTRPDVFFTDSAWTGATNYMNQRSWRKQSASQSIAAMRAGGVNSVIAGVVVVVRDTGVITPTNAALVWSYCRYTPTAYEADGGGRSIWMPITPKWVSQPFVP